MTVTPSDSPPWGFVQWCLTGIGTVFAGALAFFWRLMLRLETLEAGLARQGAEIVLTKTSSETSLSKLSERVGQVTDNHFRLRESLGALPTRMDLRDLEERLIERLDALSNRLDRAIDH